MVKRLAIVGLLLAVLVAGPFSSASTDSFEAACADAHLWLSTAIPPGLLEFMCAVYEGGSPVTVESGDESVLFQQDLRIDTDRHPPPGYPQTAETRVPANKRPEQKKAVARKSNGFPPPTLLVYNAGSATETGQLLVDN